MTAETVSAIRKYARKRFFPDGEPYTSLSLTDAKKIADKVKRHLRRIEVIALENNVIPERYSRNMKTLSVADQILLLNACITVVGLGGLGGNVVENLSRLGIGTLHLVDGDRFEDSNLNRQLFSNVPSLDTLKTEAAVKRVHAVNPAVDVYPHCSYLKEGNAGRLIGDVDVVVDCLDNIESRFILEAASKTAVIPLVSAAIAGTTGQVTVVFPTDSGLTSIYGNRDQAHLKGVETTLGTLPYTAAFFSALACSEVTKILLKRGGILRNKLLVGELSEAIFDVLKLT